MLDCRRAESVAPVQSRQTGNDVDSEVVSACGTSPSAPKFGHRGCARRLLGHGLVILAIRSGLVEALTAAAPGVDTQRCCTRAERGIKQR